MIVKGESLRASLCTAVLLSVVLLNGCAGARELMLVGNDEKTNWNDAGAASTAWRARTKCWSSTSAAIASRPRSSRAFR